MKLAYYCMDNPEHQMFKANVDGVLCVECDGLVNIKPVSVDEYKLLPKYRDIRKKNNKK